MPLSADADNKISNNSSITNRASVSDTEDELEQIEITRISNSEETPAAITSSIASSTGGRESPVDISTNQGQDLNDSAESDHQMTTSSNESSNLPANMNNLSGNGSPGVSTSRASPFSAFRFTRDIIERRAHEETRNWRDNISNVFMEIRPLVQQNVNNSSILSSWLPTNSRPVHRPTDLISDRIRSLNHLNNPAESVIINFDAPTLSQAPLSPSLSNSAHLGHGSMPSANYPRLFYHNQNLHNSHHHHHHNHHHHHGLLMHHGGASERTHGEHQDLNLDSNDSHDDGEIYPVLGGPSNSTAGGPTSSSRNHTHNHNHQNQQENPDGPVTEAFAQIPEARAVMTTLNRYIPYICILLVKSCYDHLDGILDFFALFITFSHANWIVRQEIAKQHQRKTLNLLRELLYIVLVIAIIGFMLEKKNIFISLIFTPSSSTEPFTLRNLLFSVGITDLILKLITVGVKIIITLLPPTIVEYKGRGRIFLMTESVSQLYRSMAPIQPWLVYLLDSYTGSEKIMGVILSAAYMVAKGTDLLSRAKFCKRSLVKLLQKVSFGTTPTKEQLQAVGGQCPICHDDFNGPVMLECTHIFCELCVGTWFDREQTCPLCRAKVVDDTSWRDGSTTFFVQFY